jgi:hypothetical protein
VFLIQQTEEGVTEFGQVMQRPLWWAASLVHWFAAGVLGPNTCLHHWAQFLLAPKTLRMPPKPKKLPTEAVTIVRSACRREVELARALVSSSKLVGSKAAPLLRARLRKNISECQAFFSTISGIQAFSTEEVVTFA